MDTELLRKLGEALGIGGLALGVFFLLFRELIRKTIFPQLKKDDAYRLLRLITVLIWSIAVIGIAAWLWANANPPAGAATTTGPQSPIVRDTKGEVRIEYNAPPTAPKSK
jgi:hypothetical protein